MLFLHHMRRRLWILPAITLALALMLGFLNALEGFNETWPPEKYYAVSNVFEVYTFVLSALCCCFILYSRDETEMAAVYGASPARLLLCQYVPVLIYSYLPIPWFRLIVFGTPLLYYQLSSYAVTLLFVTSAALLGRLLLNSTYASTGLVMVVFYPFSDLHSKIGRGLLPIEYARFDLYITGFLGTRVRVPPGMWEFNRLMFAGIAVVMFILCIILVRKERVYQG